MSNSPIILVGTHRSGTTWLGNVFSRHSDLAYWVEPRHVWTWGHAKNADDILTAAEATDRVTAHIHQAFENFVREHGKKRLIEKTPSNCLRLSFVRKVYPDAKIILVVRDGRSVLRSTKEIMAGGVPIHRIVRRAMQTPLGEWPAYAGQARSAIWRKVMRKPVRYWGPRPEGWSEWLNEPTEVILAKQWAGTIGRAVDDMEAMGKDDAGVYRFRYEDLLARPREEFERIVEFAELDGAEDLVAHVEQTADASKLANWREVLDEQTLDLVRPHMEPMLTRLGYTW